MRRHGSRGDLKARSRHVPFRVREEDVLGHRSAVERGRVDQCGRASRQAGGLETKARKGFAGQRRVLSVQCCPQGGFGEDEEQTFGFHSLEVILTLQEK